MGCRFAFWMQRCLPHLSERQVPVSTLGWCAKLAQLSERSRLDVHERDRTRLASGANAGPISRDLKTDTRPNRELELESQARSVSPPRPNGGEMVPPGRFGTTAAGGRNALRIRLADGRVATDWPYAVTVLRSSAAMKVSTGPESILRVPPPPDLCSMSAMNICTTAAMVNIHAATAAVRWNTIAAVGTKAINFAIIAAVARNLTPAELGTYGLAAIALGLLQEFGDGGAGNAIIRDPSMPQEHLQQLKRLNLKASFGLGLIGIAAGFLWSRTGGHEVLSLLLAMLAFSLFIAAPGNFKSWLLRRNLAFRQIAVTEIGAAIVGLVGAVVFTSMGLGPVGLALSYLLRTAIRTVLYAALKVEPLAIDAQLATRPRVDPMRFANLQIAERVVYFCGNNLDFIVIGTLLGAEALGFYMLAYNLILGTVRFVNPLVTNVALPAFGAFGLTRSQVGSTLNRITGLVGVIVSCLMLCFALLSVQTIQYVYGPDWAIAAPILIALTPFGVVYSIRHLTHTALVAEGLPGISLITTSLTMATLLTLEVVGARVAGVQGVAWAVTFTGLLVVLPMDTFIRARFLAIAVTNHVARNSAWVASAAATFVLVTIASRYAPTEPLFVVFTLRALLAFVVYAVLLRILAFPVWSDLRMAASRLAYLT